MMKFAFLIMGDFKSGIDRASIHHGTAQIIGVSSIQEACSVAKELYDAGIDCIELCGAFEAEGAKMIIEATENKIPVGYITHLQEQDKLYDEVFKS